MPSDPTPHLLHVTDSARPTLTDIGGRPVVLTYSSLASEYEALRARAVVIDHSHRGRMRITGDRAIEMLNGLVTNDVAAIDPGHGCYAAALTPKGKIVADLRIFREADGLLVDAPPLAAAAWIGIVRKYVNPRIAPHRDESATLRTFGVYGPLAHHVVAAVTGGSPTAFGTLPMYAHATATLGDGTVVVARIPDAGTEGFAVYLPAAHFDAAWQRAVAAHATPAGLAAWDVARVEAGYPEWGVDIDENTIPQEANLDELHAISYTKGCYTGQEVVARVHFRGHVNRHLRGVSQAADEDPVPTGAQLVDAAGKLVGDVRSTVRSPRLGPIGLAMIRREVAPGTTLAARWDGGAGHVVVNALPFAG